MDEQDLLTEHVAEYHAFKKDELVGMVDEHESIIRWIDRMGPTIEAIDKNVNLIVNDLYGERHPTAANPDQREGGLAATLQRIENTVDSAIAQGFTTKREWTNGQWAFAGAVLTTVAAFVIRGWF
jgi:hypothetical protein